MIINMPSYAYKNPNHTSNKNKLTAPPLFFGNENELPESKNTKPRWTVKALVIAGLSTLSFFGYQQNETNSRLTLQNEVMAEKLLKTNSHMKEHHQDLLQTQEKLKVLQNLVIRPETIAQVKASTAQVLAMGGKKRISSGSGVWIKEPKSGKIFLLTNQHVTKGKSAKVAGKKGTLAENIFVTRRIHYEIKIPNHNKKLKAALVYQNKEYDLSLLSVDKLPKSVKVATLRDIKTHPLLQGEPVFSMGSPANLEDTATEGIISNTARMMSNTRTDKKTAMIQTDAPINPGNSGGGLFDSQGRLIGINEMIFRSSKATDGLGFTIRVDRVKDFINNWEKIKADEKTAKIKAKANVKK